MIDRERNARLCIHPEYDDRLDPVHFDDRHMRDEWQDGVYAFARDYAVRHGFRKIIDFGCGSGFKLMKYFAGFDTLGYEVEPALAYLGEQYPDRQWRHARFADKFAGDFLICADVIEHLSDPVELLAKIKAGPLQAAILSTPALEILTERGESPRLGPPDNKSHVNEWTTREFRDFVAMHLRVIDQMVISCVQGTQLIVVAPK